MKITFLTLFPEFFDCFKQTSIINKAINKNVVEIETVNIRDYSLDKNKRVDDAPVGGGPGVIFRCDPVIKAINNVKNENSKVIFLSSRGVQFNQDKARDLANSNQDLILLCGHYEGIDERILTYVDEEISIGDYILTGGEIPAMVIADSVIRLLKGAIKEESHLLESYENGLLEYPQYTLPKVYDEKEIPEILFCGNHEVIRKWRLKESLKITMQRRSDLLNKYIFNKEELELMKEIKENRVGKWEIDAIKKSKKITVHNIKKEKCEFYEIKSGNKRYEICNEKKEKYKAGDEICFLNKSNLKEFFYKRIKMVHRFQSVDKLVNYIDVKFIGFAAVEELIENMKKRCSSSLNECEIVVIELEC